MKANVKCIQGDSITISPHEVYYQESVSYGRTYFGGEDFTFCIEEFMVEDNVLVGVIGRVTSSGLFNGLICSAMKRFDGDTWREFPNGGANFKIARTRVTRVAGFEAGHPFGTTLDYPFYAGIGMVRFLQ